MTVPKIHLEQLVQAAKESSAHAYCPYSNFPVGAAVLTSEGQIFSGSNVENASFGLSICAERNAVFQAVSKSTGRLEIKMIVIYTPTDTPTAPCGACRQVINEFGSESEILCIGKGKKTIRLRLGELLPNAFGPNDLE